MTKRLPVLSVILSILIAATAIASDTRGLSVVAKDPATGRSAEIHLYNKTYAVIIGIDKYLNLSPSDQLKNAVRDARGVEDVLRKHYHFDRIVTLYDEQATRDRILEVLSEELPRQMGKQDALFVFWAGHGNQEKSDYGDLGYLIPFDGSVDKIRTDISMAEIRDTISKTIPAKHIFYVIDACYSGLLTTRSVEGKTPRDLSYLKKITEEPVRQVLTAGSKGEEALDSGPMGYSVFTGRFIEQLANANDFITANEIQASIKEGVYSDAKARNNLQTPGFGVLYGLGDFVFIPKEQNRLNDLSANSVARQKELEQLRKAEADAAVAKQKEQAEISKKERELAELDKEIAQMKTRLGTSAAKSGDNLDAIVALAEQKEEQGKHLEELRQQRETEERKRQEEIERLKEESLEKLAEQVRADMDKYRKVASSKYAQDMKGTAWDALIANYPEAKSVKMDDVDGFWAALGLTQYYNGVILTSNEKRSIEEKSQGVIDDSGAGLEWVKAPNQGMTWNQANAYVRNLNIGGGDWRLPTIAELKSLYDRFKSGNGLDEFGVKNKFAWSSELDGQSEAWGFFFIDGTEEKYDRYDTISTGRVLAVRSRR